MAAATSATVNYNVLPLPALTSQLGDLLRAASSSAIAERGVFHVALSGGSLPATLGRALIDANIDTSAWHWWFADERCVGLADPDSNYAEAKKHVFDHLPSVRPDQIHPIDETLAGKPKEAAAAYEAALRAVVPDGRLDVLLLGMGPDGHCCSLFPSHPLLDEHQLWIAPITDSPKPPSNRITMTYPLINLARASYFVATGASKADALLSIFGEQADTRGLLKAPSTWLPARRVRSHQTLFLVDPEAASKLPKRD